MPECKRLTSRQAVNAEDPMVLPDGADVAKPGGSFGVTRGRGVWRRFGAEQVVHHRTGEAAVLGSAVGAALANEGAAGGEPGGPERVPRAETETAAAAALAFHLADPATGREHVYA